MASGLLGKADLTANTDTTIYTCPASAVTTANINLVNTAASATQIKLSIGTNPPSNEDFIEYNTSIPANGVLERSGIVMSENEILVAKASGSGIVVRAFGFTEVA